MQQRLLYNKSLQEVWFSFKENLDRVGEELKIQLMNEGYTRNKTDEIINKAKLNCQKKMTFQIKPMFDEEMRRIVEDDKKNQCRLK